MVVGAIAGAVAKGAAKGAASQAVKSGGRNAARRAASREADKLRKRYRREKNSLQAKLDSGGLSTKYEKSLNTRISNLDKKLEALTFNRKTGGYGISTEEMQIANFESKRSTKAAKSGLKISGQSAQFYADARDLWAHDKTPGKSTNQKIIDSLNSRSFTKEAKEKILTDTGIDLDKQKITELDEAIRVMSSLTGTDYYAKPEESENLEPWAKYKEEQAIAAALAIASATKRK